MIPTSNPLNPLKLPLKQVIFELVLIIGISLATKLLLLPYSTINQADSVSRIWNAWNWLSNPQLITSGVWGPLHTYLIGISLKIYLDPILTPILLNIFFSLLTSICLYFFTLSEFACHRASFFVSIAYVFYPLAINSSLVAMSEVPFCFFISLTMLLLSRAKRSEGLWKYTVLAGFALTLSGMIRYEGWMLIPFFSVCCAKNPKNLFLFIICAMIHPIFWMIGNTLAFNNPFYSFTTATHWIRDIEHAHQTFDFRSVIMRLMFFPCVTFLGLTLVSAIISLAGVFLSLSRNKSRSEWLIPFLGLLFILSFGCALGSVFLKVRYTLPLGTLLIPYIAQTYVCLNMSSWSFFKRTFLEFGCISFIIIFSFFSPNLYLSNYASEDDDSLNSLSYQLSAIPAFGKQNEAKMLSKILNSHLKSLEEGIICDFFGWKASYLVALSTRIHPNKIFMAPGGRYQKLDTHRLSALVNNSPIGLLIINKDSRFSKNIALNVSKDARVGTVSLHLQMLDSVIIGDSVIELYRYSRKNPSL